MPKKIQSSSNGKKSSGDGRTTPKNCIAEPGKVAHSARNVKMSQKELVEKANKHMTKAWGILSNQKGK